MPVYSGFLGHTITLDYLGNWPFVAAMIAIAGLTGLIGGIYPAFILSSFRPGRVLHSKCAGAAGTCMMRTILVVFQFAVSIGLAIAAAVIFTQIRFASHLDLGFDRDNIVIVHLNGAGLSPASLESMSGEVSALPGVSGVAMSDKVPGSGNSPANVVRIAATGATIQVMNYSVRPNSPPSMASSWKPAASCRGPRHRPASRRTTGRWSQCGIDDHAARAFGYTPDSAVGKTIDVIGGRVTIVGVVHNVLFAGAQAVHSPTVF